MRERLIELLEIAHKHCSDCDCSECSLRCETDCEAINIADYLLDNGVIVLPCKVGDTVWAIAEMDGYVYKQLVISEPQAVFIKDLWNNRYFTTKEEAEAKLKELQGE